jgi:hypothetical protein
LRQFQTPLGIDEIKRLVLRINKAIPQFQTFPPKGGYAGLELPARTPMGIDQWPKIKTLTILSVMNNLAGSSERGGWVRYFNHSPTITNP